MEKKAKVIEFIVFSIILVVLIINYCTNKEEKHSNEYKNEKIVETVLPKETTDKKENVSEHEEVKSADADNSQNDSSSNENMETYSSGSVKADGYFAETHIHENQNEERENAEDGQIVEVEDGIEIIQNPQEGVQ